MNKNEIAFLITAFDQIREVTFTVNMLRTKWRKTRKAPIVIVVSGDHDRSLMFRDDDFTHVVHIDDIVGDNTRCMQPTSIMRQIEHGMKEIKWMEHLHGDIESIIHMHGDILLLDEAGFFEELKRWRQSGKPIAVDNVGPNGPHYISTKEYPDVKKDINMIFMGQEIMPQLFAVDHKFCSITGYMYDMEICGNLEEYATEWALIGNLYRCLSDSKDLHLNINEWKQDVGPYKDVFDENIHIVKQNRGQWGIHNHWGGFCHFGCNVHVSKEDREYRSYQALMKHNIDMEAWK